MKAKKFLTDQEDRVVVDAIRAAESQTSAQVRVLITHQKVDAALTAAHAALHKLGMTRTTERNAVLIFVAPRNRKFAIAADRAAHEKLGDPVWQRLAAALKEGFTAGHHAQTIARVVADAGAELRKVFPHKPDGKNNLPDDVVEQ